LCALFTARAVAALSAHARVSRFSPVARRALRFFCTFPCTTPLQVSMLLSCVVGAVSLATCLALSGSCLVVLGPAIRVYSLAPAVLIADFSDLMHSFRHLTLSIRFTVLIFHHATRRHVFHNSLASLVS